MIGRNRDVRGTALDHAQHGGEHASDRGYLAPMRIPRGGQRVVVPDTARMYRRPDRCPSAAPTEPYRTGVVLINYLRSAL